MPECHNCRWNSEPPTDEKTAACTACRLPPSRVNHKGKVWVSIDARGGNGTPADKGAQTLAEVEASLQRAHEADGTAYFDEGETDAAEAVPLAECCRHTAFEILDFMGDLEEREIKLLVEVAHGATLADIARRKVLSRAGRGGPEIPADQPLTRAAVSALWRGILRKSPRLAGVLSVRGDRRRAPT